MRASRNEQPKPADRGRPGSNASGLTIRLAGSSATELAGSGFPPVALPAFQLVVKAQPVALPGNYGDMVNPFGNGFDAYQQHQYPGR